MIKDGNIDKAIDNLLNFSSLKEKDEELEILILILI